MSRLRLDFDLQSFAGEKTEQATPKRRQDARRKGQVGKSAELSGALVLLAGILAIYFLLPIPAVRLIEFARATWLNLSVGELDISTVSRLAWQVSAELGLMLLPLFAVLMLVAWMSSMAQVGFLLSGHPLQPSLNRLNPLEGIKRMFSKRALVELAKSLFKLGGIALMVYQSVSAAVAWSISHYSMEMKSSFFTLARIIFNTSLKVGLFLLVIGLADFIYQRFEFSKSLRMSKQEVKEEYKQAEGDPQLRARIREKQRLMARQRMMQDVPKADVVIVNPVHLAIAIKYEVGESAAPQVLAKGQGYLALKIKEMAKEHQISIVEDKPLAQALFKVVDVGDLIPPDFYQAVAEILAFVYRTKKRRF